MVVVLLLGALLAGEARASPIAAAHRAINASYHSQQDGYWHGRIASCRRVRGAVDCAVTLTGPLLDCQPGTVLLPVAGLGPCESPPPTSTIHLRFAGGQVQRVP